MLVSFEQPSVEKPSDADKLAWDSLIAGLFFRSDRTCIAAFLTNLLVFSMPDISAHRLRFVADGDSILSNGLWLRFALDGAGGRYELPDHYNQAVGGATARRVLDKIQDVTGMSPDVVALHVGTNDLSSYIDGPEAIYENIKKICRTYIDHGACCVIVVCVLPRSDFAWRQLGSRYKDRYALNTLLRRMPRDPGLGPHGKRIRIVDLEASFDPLIQTADGLHLSLTGARMLGRAIGRHLAAIAADGAAEPGEGAPRRRGRFGRRRGDAGGWRGWLSNLGLGRLWRRYAI